MSKENIKIIGAKEHNLKSIDVQIPKGKLVVITGPSGSGKSSLALDTIYAEGKRRYVESLSSYARQFLGISKRPNVEKIEGLCPAIAIEQKTVGYNPRSTVGTITEIYDYLRVLFARIGTPHCPSCGVKIQAESPENITKMILKKYKNNIVTIAAPIAVEKKGEFKKELTELFENGFYRFLIDGKNHRFKNLIEIENLKIKKRFKHNISVLIDSLKVEQIEAARVQEAVEKAFKVKGGLCSVICEDGRSNGSRRSLKSSLLTTNGSATPAHPDDAQRAVSKDQTYSAHRICLTCVKSFPELEPRFFSFNSPIGACTNCHGLGFTQEWPWQKGDRGFWKTKYPDHFGKHVKEKTCTYCNGKRLKDEVLAVTINLRPGGYGSQVSNKNIYDVCQLSISDTLKFFKFLKLTPEQEEISASLLREIVNRLSFLKNVGLSYLTLSRTARTLSGGEGQRIRLATQLGCALSGVIYILDEPSIGLHQRDNNRLIKTLKMLRDLGNTVLVVEHDMDTIRSADYLIDMGPEAGVLGGEVTAKGNVKQLAANPNSLTGSFLSGKREIALPEKRRKYHSHLMIKGATANNLKNVDVKIPLGVFVAVSGVSGSGKSSLIMQTLAPALQNFFSRGFAVSGYMDELEGVQQLSSVVKVDQSPIGRTPRSNPATYLGIFDEIRKLYASLPESNARGYKVGRFSFNVPEGRCFECKGDGRIKISMHFLEDVIIKCKSCKGKRYNEQTLEIKYKNKNIYQILDMTVLEAIEFFKTFPRIYKRLSILQEVGLDYLKLGQPSTTLSGGEAQRIKLVNELAKRGKNCMYILDEPTTGLHSSDVDKLLHVLNRLVNRGNTVLVIEHNLDVLKSADYIIDLGPEGGDAGGYVVATGAPEIICRRKKSFTGKYLKNVLHKI